MERKERTAAGSQKNAARLNRQIDALTEAAPQLRGPLDAVRSDRYRLVRVPVAILLMAGSVLAVLPVFGLWMLPLGVALLALDVPALQPAVAAVSIRLRRWLRRRKATPTTESR